MGFVKYFKKTEAAFAEKLIEVAKGEVSSSNENEDIHEHWDIKIETKFDVKAVKKINRYDEKPNENIHWVEIKNVNGELGWLYGEADYFAFELDDYWVIVDKISLQNFMKEKLKSRELSEKPEIYKLYRRKGRKDLITLVKTVDLMALADHIIKK